MSVSAERAAPAGRRTRVREIIREFSPEELKAPFILRCGALLVDYIIVVAVPVASLLFGKLVPADGTTGSVGGIGWLLAVLVAISNLVVIPALSGQSLGKMLAGIRIIRINGRPAPMGSVVLRNTVGYLLTCLTFGIGFLVAAFGSNGRALHDYVSGTMVVYGRRRVLK